MTISDLYNIVRYIPTTVYLEDEYHEWDINNPDEVETFLELEIIDKMNETTGEFCEYIFTSSPPKPLIELLKHKLELYVKWYKNCIGRVQKELLFRLDEFYVTCDEWLSIIDDAEKEQGNFLEGDYQEGNKLNLPNELNTKDARKYFTRAIKAGYIKKENNGYKWIFGGGKGQARLGYFCSKVYNQPRPISKLEKLFGVSKLSASITNAEVEPKRADVKEWRKEIDDKIFF